MELHRFANNRGDTRISADRLDENFARLKPLPQDGAGRYYSITETPDGWKLELYPEMFVPEVPEAQSPLPEAPTSGTHVLGVVNGTIQWIATEACG